MIDSPAGETIDNEELPISSNDDRAMCIARIFSTNTLLMDEKASLIS